MERIPLAVREDMVGLLPLGPCTSGTCALNYIMWRWILWEVHPADSWGYFCTMWASAIATSYPAT